MKYSDIGTPERHFRNELEIRNPEGIQKKATVRNVSPIHNYYKRNQITAVQFAAGEALYRHYTIGWIGYYSCEIRERINRGSNFTTISERQLQGIEMYVLGMKAVGEEDRNLVCKTVIEELPMTNKKMSSVTKKRLKQRLCAALDRVALVYQSQTRF